MIINKLNFLLVVIIIIVVTSSIYLITETATCNSTQTNIENNKSIIIKDSLKDTTKDYLLNPILITTDLKNEWYKLHFDAILLDAHNDLLYKYRHENCDFYLKDPKTQTGLQRLREGGVDIQFFALYIPPKQFDKSKKYILEEINILNNLQKEYYDIFEIAHTYSDITRIIKDGKIAGMMGIEGGTAIEDEIDNINLFFEKGVRYIGLTWNNSNRIGVSAKDEANGKKGGLTNFGKEVVKRMNEVGMLIDVSHLGEQTFWDVVKITNDPIIASHSNCYSLCAHYRNLTD
ncbi:MAG: membrane dipeptidase, partial [Ignavibacteria bacterium]|nr:membrane dipeptidase [Ignavibacteria bacterium]